MKHILVTIPMTEPQKMRLQSCMPEASYSYTTEKAAGDDEIRRSNIILGNLSPEQVQKAEQLEWLQLNTSGADAYIKKGVLREGVLLTNSTGAYGLAISEHLLAQTFFLKKKLGLYHRNQMEGYWQDEGKVTAIQGSTTLVIGLGNIGSCYAARMAALGSKVYGIRRRQVPCPDYLEAVGTFDDLDAWLPIADIVALALPGTPRTQGLFNRKMLAKMKKGSILLNVGRGSTICMEAFYEALQTGPLMAAALDVTDPEPLPQGHPLWKCENLLLTPHVAGDYHLQETLDYIVELFIRNLEHYAKGEGLENPVDMETGYRRNL